MEEEEEQQQQQQQQHQHLNKQIRTAAATIPAWKTVELAATPQTGRIKQTNTSSPEKTNKQTNQPTDRKVFQSLIITWFDSTAVSIDLVIKIKRVNAWPYL